MIVGIGSDIARVERFTRAVQRHGPRFAQRILGPREHALWLQKSQPVAFLAKRFAAKEAFVKALGLGLRQGMQWGNIQVLNDALGKPYFLLDGEAARLLQAAGVTASHVTLSDEAEYAVAFVVLER
ncbi:holo-ACP synthase [Vreelandella neptunia]|uniref:Holo-[acyl-carrier-protein] synthase n=1 Tax=Vreelandella neptunia TaxID=115551 RepID=A0ABS9S2L5_9GAMM|nr:holo-ACP synthase [Halomonas neptunia]MCH4810309.1 holo-ACP synthase [Halomonas neptunia]